MVGLGLACVSDVVVFTVMSHALDAVYKGVFADEVMGGMRCSTMPCHASWFGFCCFDSGSERGGFGDVSDG